VFAISFALGVLAVDTVDGALNYVIALLLSPIDFFAGTTSVVLTFSSSVVRFTKVFLNKGTKIFNVFFPNPCASACACKWI
jgi:hypothetical protein